MAQVAAPRVEAAHAGVLAEHQSRARRAHRLGAHDFVGQFVLEHAVLVNAGFMRERVGPDNGLVRRHRHTDDGREGVAGGNEARGVDAGGERQRIGPHFERHHNFFERGVAGTLANAVDGALHLAGARLHRGNRVGDGQAEIVVAVGRQDGPVAEQLLHGREHLLDVGRQRVADGIGQVDRGGARLDRRDRNLAQECQVAARRILGRELDVGAERPGVRDRTLDLFQTLRPRDAQLVFEVDVRGGEKHMEARPGRARQSLPGTIDIGRDGPGQAGDDGPAHRGSNGLHRFEVTIRRNGEAGLDDVHAQAVQLLGEPQLLGRRHAEARGLLAVAESRIKDVNTGSGGHKYPSSSFTVSGARPK